MKYILSGGGTGGHIYPALAICDELTKQDKDAEIIYVGKKDSLEEELVGKKGYDFRPIHISGLPRKKINKETFITMVNLMRGLSESTKIINDFKPDFVIGTGKLVFSFGGSGGQESTNDAIKEIIKGDYNIDFKLVHVTGREHYEGFMKDLEIPENVKIFDYSFEVPKYLMAADLVIASSSAMTLAEISAVGLASILIPKSYTAGNHQVFNANSYKDINASQIITEDKLTGKLLYDNIEEILNNDDLRKKMAENSKKMGNPDAVSEIVREIIKFK